MAIPEPSTPLWSAVKRIDDTWPPDDEVMALDLGRALGRGADTVSRGAQATSRAGADAVASWRDAAGTKFGGQVDKFAQSAGRADQSMRRVAARAELYGRELESAKTTISNTIAANERTHAQLANPMLGVAGATLQQAYASKIADDLRTMIDQKAATLKNASVPAQLAQDGKVSDSAATTMADGEVDAKVADMEKALRDAGLLTGPPASGHYRQWLENAVRRGVPIDTIKKMAADHHIRPEDFAVLDGMEEIREDEDGNGIFKSYFLMPTDISGDDAAKAVRMTYVMNAGTDYGTEGEATDFAPTPYGSEELQRIVDRQRANDWSYNEDVTFVHGNGGRLATTPNGMMMGLGGDALLDQYSQKGGTTWGDTFMLNIDNPADPAQQLRAVAGSGHAWYDTGSGAAQGDLDMDRLLHHEERHSQQWAREGYTGFLASYLGEQVTGGNETEEDAGLSDGGYR
jgi:hypothetical protein